MQSALKYAGKPKDSIAMLEELTESAIVQHRYTKAAQYHMELSAEKLLCPDDTQGALELEEKVPIARVVFVSLMTLLCVTGEESWTH